MYKEVTKEILDTIKIGDLVKVNDWEAPMRIKGVSKNYAVMTRKMFGKIHYSVIEKKPWDGIRHNAMIGGHFHCSTDSWIFGDPHFNYEFDDLNAINEYLQKFEDNVVQLSERNGIPIHKIQIKPFIEGK